MAIDQGDVYWDRLGKKIGKLEKGRVRQILDGLFLMLEPRYII